MYRGVQSAGPIAPGYAAPRSIALATAYQALNPLRPALVVLTFSVPATLLLSAGTTVTGDVRIGADASVATGGGVLVAPYKKSLTGVLGVGVSLATDDYETKTFLLPANAYFAVRQLSGAGMLVVSASEQAIN